MGDIKKKRLRPIIPPELIFKDDPVRMIRALKYAVAGGFAIPWLLQRRIKSEGPLLGKISASRLTEELAKIIRSPYASQIVETLDKAGLYEYLQKDASVLLKSNPAFRGAYLKSLAEGSAEPGEGRVLAALVRDYLEIKSPWQDLKKGSWEDYRTVFFDARHFILPMNPPRVELEKAVKLIFTEHGIELKKIRLFDRDRNRSAVEHGSPEAPANPRRRRRRRPAGPSPAKE
jgi:poly(A) polymerase